jgi:hypothetical protein
MSSLNEYGRIRRVAQSAHRGSAASGGAPEVIEIAGHDISEKGQGGPTCLTRPLPRE